VPAGRSVDIITKLQQTWSELPIRKENRPEVTSLFDKLSGMDSQTWREFGVKLMFDDFGKMAISLDGDAAYYVYVRRSDDWALVHRARCRFPSAMRCSRHEPKSSTGGVWLGPFASCSDGFAAAGSQGITRVRGCTYCKP
jgi:hypothetical protein